MRNKDFLTDEQVEMEIERLLDSEDVRLAKKETRIKLKRRQYLYQLRWMENRGKQLAKEGEPWRTSKKNFSAILQTKICKSKGVVA